MKLIHVQAYYIVSTLKFNWGFPLAHRFVSPHGLTCGPLKREGPLDLKSATKSISSYFSLLDDDDCIHMAYRI
ncbi:uncharacterized protein DS421_13g407820 [Arachis hypogaea]|nr:uncharacterized protein DS421_13g407820 [Arachis hypogaea]